MSTSEPRQDRGVPPRRRGRRPGGHDTRTALLEAARAAFIEQGYDGATVRTIAANAGVDPAMVNHWFGGKEGLFTASVSIPVDPTQLISQLLDGDREHLGEHMVRNFLTVWDTAGGGGFVALVRSVASHDSAVRMLREFVTTVLFGRITRALDVDQPELRASLCGTQIVGLGMMRYVVALEPLAGAEHDTVVAAIGPTLQRYLTGDIGKQ